MTDLKDIRLNTITGITEAIEKMVGQQPKGDKPSPVMLTVFEAVIEQIEQYGGFDAGISRAMQKVRQQLGLKPRPTKKPQETTDANQ